MKTILLLVCLLVLSSVCAFSPRSNHYGLQHLVHDSVTPSDHHKEMASVHICNEMSKTNTMKPLAMFGFKSSKTPAPPKRETIIVPKDYNVAGGFLAIAGALLAAYHEGGAGTNTAIAFALIGTFLTIQTGKIRFVFDDEALEVLVQKGEDTKPLEASRENFAVGGRNRWAYSSFTNWLFIPSRSLPILMYFKETQTRPEGQIHFFPVIMKADVLDSVMTERIGKKN